MKKVENESYNGPERRRDPFEGVPWPVRLIAANRYLFPAVVIITFMFPILLLAFREAQDAGFITSRADDLTRSVLRLERHFADHDARAVKAIEKMADFWSVICRIQAKGGEQRELCERLK